MDGLGSGVGQSRGGFQHAGPPRDARGDQIQPDGTEHRADQDRHLSVLLDVERIEDRLPSRGLVDHHVGDELGPDPEREGEELPKMFNIHRLRKPTLITYAAHPENIDQVLERARAGATRWIRDVPPLQEYAAYRL